MPQPASPLSAQIAPLGLEEYIEQAYFFQRFGERIRQNEPAQEILSTLQQEVLATTKLPLAIDFLLNELKHTGALAPGMKKLAHYFTSFQCFVVSEAEKARGKFDFRVGLEILQREAEYRASENPTLQGLFLFQFEALCRNRLGYDPGLFALSKDPSYDSTWATWLLKIRKQIGMLDIADLIYIYSAYYQNQQTAPGNKSWLKSQSESPSKTAPQTGHKTKRKIGTKTSPEVPSETVFVLFGEKEGRIALANRKKDPALLFSSLQRQLRYPAVPFTQQAEEKERQIPLLLRKVEQLEIRIKILEEEQRGGLDLSQFYEKPSNPTDSW